MERWHAQHRTLGLVEVFVGTYAELHEMDPEFPVARVAIKDEVEKKDEDTKNDEELAELKEQFEGWKNSDSKWKSRAAKAGERVGEIFGDHPYLVKVDGQIITRWHSLGEAKIDLSECKNEGNKDSGGRIKTGKKDSQGFHREIAVTKPFLKMDTGAGGSWLRMATIQAGGAILEMDPPPGSRAAKRIKAMDESPFKRWLYPLLGGLGKSGWAIFCLVVLPLLGKILDPIFRFIWSLVKPIFEWLAQFIPDIDWPTINWPTIKWPEINLPSIPWPEINIPWPDWELPHWDMPWIVEMALEYPKVWVPIVIGIAFGITSVRSGRKTREAKIQAERQNMAGALRARIEQLQVVESADQGELASTKEKE